MKTERRSTIGPGNPVPGHRSREKTVRPSVPGSTVGKSPDTGEAYVDGDRRTGSDQKRPGCSVPGFQQEALPRTPGKDRPAGSSGDSRSVHPDGQLAGARQTPPPLLFPLTDFLSVTPPCSWLSPPEWELELHLGCVQVCGLPSEKGVGSQRIPGKEHQKNEEKFCVSDYTKNHMMSNHDLGRMEFKQKLPPQPGRSVDQADYTKNHMMSNQDLGSMEFKQKLPPQPGRSVDQADYTKNHMMSNQDLGSMEFRQKPPPQPGRSVDQADYTKNHMMSNQDLGSMEFKQKPPPQPGRSVDQADTDTFLLLLRGEPSSPSAGGDGESDFQ
ncbi:unnamed protein product [Rangifer tarandus platyrhynchus]|uniref:Uncharacterized protein n=1 Tax=Rangifer tarandus platyrhynchus TaxID=3082113 RepID=A0ABN8ZTP6_RANTA|nr:unnamed protein product [Rangifer tarandus platyrhynchus]